MERRLIQQTLEETRWNRREAARRLKISYKALLNKMKRWEVGADEGAPAAQLSFVGTRTRMRTRVPLVGWRRLHAQMSAGPLRRPRC